MQADAVPIKYRIAGEIVAFLQQPCRRNRIHKSYVPCCLVVDRQHLTCRAWMEKSTATICSRIRTSFTCGFLWARTRWNCPKANRIDDTNGNRNGCMQLSFQSARKCLKTIPVQQKDRRWRILRCARKNTAVQIICIGGIFMTLSLLVRQSYYYGTADSGIVSVLSACIFETAE